MRKRGADARNEAGNRWCWKGGRVGGGGAAPVAVGDAHSVQVAQHVAATDAALQVGVLDEWEKEVRCGYVPYASVTRGFNAAVHGDAAAADALEKLF
jgi:hypothetical protein